MKKARLICQSEPRFFGLTPENKDVILEQLFVLMKHINFSYKDAYNLPIWKRTWFIGKLKETLEQEQNHYNNQSTPSQNNSRNIFKKQF